MQDFWPRAIIHIDMDAFFAAVEQLDNPELRGKPVIIGGPAEKRGVVSTASYEARKFGVHSAMPMSQALRLCPKGIVIFPRGKRYSEVSRQIHEIFTHYTPLVEPLSIDEAFLDVTGSQKLFGPAPAIASLIKKAIKEETGLTASAGVAPNMFVAKLASDLEKPDGLVIVREKEILDRLAPLPIRKLWGAGPKMCDALKKYGINTIGDIRKWEREKLQQLFGDTGIHLHNLSCGIDDREIETEHEMKSISHEITFDKDIRKLDILESSLRMLADKVASRMRRKGVVGKTIFLKLRYDDFSTVTRQRQVSPATSLAKIMATTAIALMREKTQAGSRKVRLIGIGMGKLEPEGTAGQTTLFGREQDEKSERLERIADMIREKHGDDSIVRADLLGFDPDE